MFCQSLFGNLHWTALVTSAWYSSQIQLCLSLSHLGSIIQADTVPADTTNTSSTHLSNLTSYYVRITTDVQNLSFILKSLHIISSPIFIVRWSKVFSTMDYHQHIWLIRLLVSVCDVFFMFASTSLHVMSWHHVDIHCNFVMYFLWHKINDSYDQLINFWKKPW